MVPFTMPCDGCIAGGFDIGRQAVTGVVGDLQALILKRQCINTATQRAGLMLGDHVFDHGGPVIGLAGNDQGGRQGGLIRLGAKPQHVACILGGTDRADHRLGGAGQDIGAIGNMGLGGGCHQGYIREGAGEGLGDR